MLPSLSQAAESLPQTYPGPGGTCAVLRNGEVLVRHAWGYANAERRIAFTPDTLFRICSITKQFTCGALLSAFPDPTLLNADVAAALPNLQQPPPSILQLCHNQSGLRDYWAVAMLHGAPAESAFGDAEAAHIIAATQTLQFAPGTRFSYTNQNFRIVSDILQRRTGKSFAALLRQHLFEPAGMHDAMLAADTRSLPDGTQGYEGTQETGFRPAKNRILWTGDAGIAATLNDMIAWERHIDATRHDPQALYNRLSAPVHFTDGAPAAYGFGLGRRSEFGHALTGHGGALRGWRSHRLYVPAERVSVVVRFNHLSDASAAATLLLEAALGVQRPAPAPCPPPAWLGAYIEPETRLAVRIDTTADQQIRLRYGHNPERLAPQPDGSAGTDGTRLAPSEAGLWMHRPAENQSSLLQPCPGAPTLDVAGTYRCGELGTALTVHDAGGALYGAFSGSLGQGRMELLTPVGPDVWALPCPRALDHTPPGDWTLAFARGDGGRVESVLVGCWLARGLMYEKQAVLF